jgi:hypothetical protein
MNADSACSVLCHPGVSHFASEFKTFGWGCGYLNAQMLLSYIKETRSQEFQNFFAGEDLPSIKKLQQSIEQGWSKGITISLL